MHLFPDNVKENGQKANATSTTARRWKFYYVFLNNGPNEKKKKNTARRLKVSLAQNPWLPGTKLRKKDYVLSFQAAGCVVPRLPSALLSCTHRSFSQPSCSSADRGHLLTCGLGSGVCGHVGTRVCRWRSVCGTCERDNLGVLLCLRCHHLVLWDASLTESRLPNPSVLSSESHVDPAWCYGAHKGTMFLLLVFLQPPLSRQSEQNWSTHLPQRTNPQAEGQQYFLFTQAEDVSFPH